MGKVLCVSMLLAENILFQDVKICFARCHDVTSCENTRGKQGWCKNRIVRYCANRRGAKTVQDDNVGQQLTRHLDFQGSTREPTQDIQFVFGKSARNAHMHFQRLSDLNRGNRPYLKSANLCKIVLILFVECPFQTLHKGLIRKVFLMHLRWSYQTVYQNFEQKCHSLICNIMIIKLWEVLGQYKPRISETPFTMPWEQQ